MSKQFNGITGNLSSSSIPDTSPFPRYGNFYFPAPASCKPDLNPSFKTSTQWVVLYGKHMGCTSTYVSLLKLAT